MHRPRPGAADSSIWAGGKDTRTGLPPIPVGSVITVTLDLDARVTQRSVWTRVVLLFFFTPFSFRASCIENPRRGSKLPCRITVRPSSRSVRAQTRGSAPTLVFTVDGVGGRDNVQTGLPSTRVVMSFCTVTSGPYGILPINENE